ncbi:LacI family DNA-binding transcriptional regulator [Streptomyces sp. NPDC001292]|uniref:LacI family DNA-binding transcriptional regulator n=1 Tax=Streptomyces sp. NPDC001292 TaxID=3364558 RepID=UPI00369011EE
MASEGRTATLQGIAEQLGLHVSTVSRVLNGPTGERGRAASGETAERIRKLARELGYRPNPHATSLRTRRSNLIGVLFPRLSEIVVATIYEGVKEEAARHRLSTFVTNTHDDPEVQRERLAMALGRRVNGVIIGDAHLDGAALSDPALRGVPFVLVNRRATDALDAADLTAVTCDDHLGGRLVAEHLLALGHRDVAVIAGEPFASTGADRTAGFPVARRPHRRRHRHDHIRQLTRLPPCTTGQSGPRAHRDSLRQGQDRHSRRRRMALPWRAPRTAPRRRPYRRATPHDRNQTQAGSVDSTVHSRHRTPRRDPRPDARHPHQGRRPVAESISRELGRLRR